MQYALSVFSVPSVFSVSVRVKTGISPRHVQI